MTDQSSHRGLVVWGKVKGLCDHGSKESKERVLEEWRGLVRNSKQLQASAVGDHQGHPPMMPTDDAGYRGQEA